MNKTPEFKFKLFGLFELSGTGTLGIIAATILAGLLTVLFVLQVN
jgi:hypothetical protein